MEDEEIRQWKLERSGIQDVSIGAILLKSRIQKRIVSKVLLHVPLISAAVVIYPLLWMHGRLILTPMTCQEYLHNFKSLTPVGDLGRISRKDEGLGVGFACVYIQNHT